jgi:MoxR-like ATPase
VIPDDVAKLSPWVLKHRLMLQPRVSISGRTPEDVIAELLKSTSIP